MVDTHTHLNFKAFKKDWLKVTNKALNAGVSKMIVVGTDLKSSQKAIKLCKLHPAIYASIGVHPHHAKAIKKPKTIEQIIKKLNSLSKNSKKVVAIGEIGLDYHHYKKSKYQTSNSPTNQKNKKRIQEELFIKQVKLAQKVNKPIIVHSREAGSKTLNLINNYKIKSKINSINGVFHCFEGSQSYLKKVLESGFYISFTGNITYSHKQSQLAKNVPLEKLLLETDSPFIIPQPLKNKSKLNKKFLRNEPKNVKIIANHHANSRKIQLIKLQHKTTQNAEKLFRFSKIFI